MVIKLLQLAEPTGNAEQVFELQCTGDNLFYANGIMAEASMKQN